MKVLAKCALVAMSVLGLSSPAFAIFDITAQYGMLSGEFKADDSDAVKLKNGSVLRVGLHIDPIPVVPIAFGVYVDKSQFEADDFAYDTAAGLEGGVQLYAWFPISIASLKPFAKISYPLYSKGLAESDLIKTTYSTSGPHVGFGVGYKLIPGLPVALNLEFDVAKQTVEFDAAEIKADAIGSVTAADKVETDYSTTAIFLGVEVGL